MRETRYPCVYVRERLFISTSSAARNANNLRETFELNAPRFDDDRRALHEIINPRRAAMKEARD